MQEREQKYISENQQDIPIRIDFTDSRILSCRESTSVESVAGNPTIRLVMRDSSRVSVFQSAVFGEMQNYQKQICVSANILQDFNQLRQTYRQSIALVYPQDNYSKFQNSQSYQIQIQNQQEQSSYQSSLLQSSVTSITPIQQIRDQTPTKNDEIPITILLILTNKEQIQSVWIVDAKGKQIKIKVSKRKALYNYLSLGLFYVQKAQLSNYKIKYSVKKSSMLIFTKITTVTLDFSTLIIDGQAGLLCEQIAKQGPDELINSCIVYAHQYLVRYLQQLQKLDVTIFKLYYKIFKKYFRAYSNKMHLVFQSLSIENSNCMYSQFFLYFIFVIYREGALQVLRENNLYQKLTFNRSSLSKILSKQRFNYYENGQYLKQFIVYTIFTYGYNIFSQNLYTFYQLAKTCILQSSPLYNRAIFSKLHQLQNKQIMLKLLHNKSINIRFISNKQIGFVQYFDAMVSYCEAKIQPLRAQKDVEQITNLLLGFLVKLNSKLQISQLDKSQEETLNKYEVRLTSLFKNKAEQFTLQIKRVGQIYIEVKGMYQFAPKVGQLFLKIIRDFIFNNCLILLKYFYNSIIYPLVIIPQQAEQITLLLDYFMKQKIKTQNIWTLMNFSLDCNKVINYQTIQFVLKKYIKFNPYIHEFNYEQLRTKIEQWLSSYKLTPDRKEFLYKLVQLLQTRKESMFDRSGFVSCIKQIKDHLVA